MFALYQLAAGNPAISVTNFGPKQGDRGMPVNILGSGFHELTSPVVKFGTTSGVNTEPKSDSHIRTEVPAIPDGSYTLVLFGDQVPQGIVVGGFTVGPNPSGLAITDVFPREIVAGDRLAIIGYGFLDSDRSREPTGTFTSTDPGRPFSFTLKGNTVDKTYIDVPFTPPALPLDPGSVVDLDAEFSFSDGATAKSPVRVRVTFP